MKAPNQAHRDPSIVPEDPRMRAYWKFHVDGSHKVPREGVRPDHFYCCSWCDPTQVSWECIPETIVYHAGGYSCTNRPVYSDREVEKFIVPSSVMDSGNPMAELAGRMG